MYEVICKKSAFGLSCTKGRVKGEYIYLVMKVIKRALAFFLVSLFLTSGAVFAQTTKTTTTAAPSQEKSSGVGQDVSAINKAAEQQIQTLRKEMEAKIKAIRDEYKIKIDAVRKAAEEKAKEVRKMRKTELKEKKVEQKDKRQRNATSTTPTNR